MRRESFMEQLLLPHIQKIKRRGVMLLAGKYLSIYLNLSIYLIIYRSI
jgi:hypothetical protein